MSEDNKQEKPENKLYSYNYKHPNGKTYVQKIKYKSTGNPVGRPRYTEEEKKRVKELRRKMLEDEIKKNIATVKFE
jgi:hypothetical protein